MEWVSFVIYPTMPKDFTAKPLPDSVSAKMLVLRECELLAAAARRLPN